MNAIFYPLTFSQMAGQLSWHCVICSSRSRTGKITELPYKPMWCHRCIHKSPSNFNSALCCGSPHNPPTFHPCDFPSLTISPCKHMTSLFIWTIFFFFKFSINSLWSYFLCRCAGRWRCEADVTGLQHGEGDSWSIKRWRHCEPSSSGRRIHLLDRCRFFRCGRLAGRSDGHWSCWRTALQSGVSLRKPQVVQKSNNHVSDLVCSCVCCAGVQVWVHKNHSQSAERFLPCTKPLSLFYITVFKQ